MNKKSIIFISLILLFSMFFFSCTTATLIEKNKTVSVTGNAILSIEPDSASMRIRVSEIDKSTKPGAIGTILRREGLYYSNIVKWREQLELGKLGKRLNEKDRKKIMELSKENRKLQRDLNRSKLIIEVQKKILQILDLEDQS